MMPTIKRAASCVARLRAGNARQQMEAVVDVVKMSEAATREDIARAVESEGFSHLAKRIREGWPHGSEHG